MNALRLHPLLCLIVILLTALAACSKEEKEMAPALDDPSAVPAMMTRDVETLISDSGYTRYKIVTPLWLIYDNIDNPHWSFPEGLDMERFDQNMKPDSRIVCDSATYFSNKKIWRLDGNVRMRNVNGDKFLTQQVFWDQIKQSVYSDSFIHIERDDRILEGMGFRSNQTMTSYSIAQPTGIFPVPERKQDSDADEEDATAPQLTKTAL